MDFNVRDPDRTQRAIAARIASHTRDLLDQFDCRIIALAKDGIAAIQAGIRNFGDKKL
jgi:hypothetical protein